MKQKLVYVFLLHSITFSVFAADNDYAVSKIDPALLTDASAVKRYELIRFEIKDPGRAIYYYKTAVTILNENGDKYSGWAEAYDDKFTTIRSIDATLYDASGKKIRALKKAEIKDLSGTDEGTLAGDARFKRHNFYYKVYPYTVEYEVEIKKDELMFIPTWTPVESEQYPVEKSIFEIICPNDYQIRFKAFNYNQEPIVTLGKSKVYHWELNKQPCISNEFSAPAWSEITPTVFVAPTEFEVQGYRGVMTSWLNLGKFQSHLNKNKDNLPANVKQKIHSLTDTVVDVKRKICLLYQYMQKNTRYISIQLGIGGWQPLEASFVAEKGYGDCKALSNFMSAILKEAGINAYYCLIKAGDNNNFYLPDFPSRQSNHAIVCVPLIKDTVWLECTDQNLQAGYLSGFTSNRFALMIKEDGGYLVHTPDYNYKDNRQLRKINSIVDEAGKLIADVNTVYSGLEQDKIFELINHYSKKEQLEFLKNEIDLPSYDIKSFDYKTVAKQIPEVEEKLSLEAENYAQVSGKRIFILPNLLTKTSLKLPDEDRINDIEIKSSYVHQDSVQIKIPSGFSIEALPSTVTIDSKFGQYTITYKLENEQILMTRLFERKAGHFAASDYKELVKMYADMYKADRGKIVLIKKEG